MQTPMVTERAAGALLLSAAFALVVAVYVFGNAHKNAWSVIDDHEILAWFGSGDRVPPSDFGRLLATTEVLDPSRATRFRPVYYVVRIGEAVVFGKNVAPWYVAHEVMFAACVFFLAYAAVRYLASGWLDRVVALACTALFVSRTYWCDSFARLGPSESYAILGSSLALLGFVAVFVGGDRRPRWYWASLLGTLFAAGSKENLLVLAVPLAVLAVRDWSRLRWSVRAALAIALLLLVAEAAWVVRIVSAAGADIYGNPVALGGRLALVRSFFARPEVLVTGAAAVALGVGLLVHRARRPGAVSPAARHLAILGALFAGAVALAATQYVFYAGKLPAGSRYDFPYVAAFDAALVALVMSGLRLVRAALPDGRGSRPAIAIVAAIAVGALALPAFAGLGTMRADMRWLRKLNQLFTARLSRAVEVAERTGAQSVVLHAQRGIDYEPVMSIQRHLVARNVATPIFLTFAPGAEAASEVGWEKGLLAEMRRWSARGFEAIRALPDRRAGACFGFGFHAPPPAECAHGTDIWPMDFEAWSRGE